MSFCQPDKSCIWCRWTFCYNNNSEHRAKSSLAKKHCFLNAVSLSRFGENRKRAVCAKQPKKLQELAAFCQEWEDLLKKLSASSSTITKNVKLLLMSKGQCTVQHLWLCNHSISVMWKISFVNKIEKEQKQLNKMASHNYLHIKLKLK